MAHVVDELELPETSFFAWDARAHGRSEGEQGPDTTMATFVQDLDEFMRHIQSEFGIAQENIACRGAKRRRCDGGRLGSRLRAVDSLPGAGWRRHSR